MGVGCAKLEVLDWLVWVFATPPANSIFQALTSVYHLSLNSLLSNSKNTFTSFASFISATDIPYVKIFILPPSMEVLKQRLILRATDSEEEIAKRLQIAKEELAYIPQYQ